MPVERIANLLVLLLLIEMMVTVGLGVSVKDIANVFTNVRLLLRGGLANYVLVPAFTILLLHLFQAQPMVAVGFLLVAVCPGAPFAPPLARLASGNVQVSVGLMVVLSASSAILAPLLLSLLLRLTAESASLKIDTLKIVTTLLMTQLFPLAIGLLLRQKRPYLAQRLLKPANLLMAILSVVVFALIIDLQFRTLLEIHWKGYLGISTLVLLCLAAGLSLGGQPAGHRRALGWTTAARNVGVALVIATASFPGTAAVSAIIVFAIFQTILLGLTALLVGRLSPAPKTL